MAKFSNRSYHLFSRSKDILEVAKPMTSLAVNSQEPMTLEAKHEALVMAHLRLRSELTRSIRFAVLEQDETSKNVKNFADRSMATVAAWILSQTCNAAIASAMEGCVSEAHAEILSRSIYAAVTGVFVPLMSWSLRRHEPNNSLSCLSEQVMLLKLCLPMFVAWAWKDFVGAVINLKPAGHILWAEFAVASSMSVAMAVWEFLPCYASSLKGVRRGGEGDTFISRYLIFPSYLGLAAGFAWDQVFMGPVAKLQKLVSAPLFVMMIQLVYYVIVTFFITMLHLRWFLYHDSESPVDVKPTTSAELVTSSDRESRNSESKVGHSMTSLSSELIHKTGDVVMDALAFVYAWAQLGTVNAIFFTYMLGCQGAQTCSYQSNFGFALGLTYVFTKFTRILKAEKRVTAWNKAATDLVNRAMSLNVGWAWSNFCVAAVTDAKSSTGVPEVLTYVMCSVFVWFFMTLAHRKFEVERRAWNRTRKQDTLEHALMTPSRLYVDGSTDDGLRVRVSYFTEGASIDDVCTALSDLSTNRGSDLISSKVSKMIVPI